MLTRRAVGETGLSVGAEDELVGAGALERSDARLSVALEEVRARRRCDETEMRASAVVLRAGIVVRQLPQRVVRVNVVRSVGRVPQHREIRAGELLGFVDRLEIPVGPVDVIVEDGEGEDVGHRSAGEHDATVVTFEIGEGYVVEMGVGPEDLVRDVVDGEGVRPGDVVLPSQDLRQVAAVHSHFPDVGLRDTIR